MNADSPLRRIYRRTAQISTVASICAFGTLCHAQSEVYSANQAAGTDVPPIATCVACHGARGAGSEPSGAPRLAGKNADYLAHALSMFKAGTRIRPPMQAAAQRLSDGDMRALADFFLRQGARANSTIALVHPVTTFFKF
jgi:cytochrome c553